MTSTNNIIYRSFLEFLRVFGSILHFLRFFRHFRGFLGGDGVCHSSGFEGILDILEVSSLFQSSQKFQGYLGHFIGLIYIYIYIYTHTFVILVVSGVFWLLLQILFNLYSKKFKNILNVTSNYKTVNLHLVICKHNIYLNINVLLNI